MGIDASSAVETQCGLVGDTNIAVADGRDYSLARLATADERERAVQACTPSGRVFFAYASANRRGLSDVVVQVTLDSGHVLRGSPDLEVLMRNGTYERIDRLTLGASLMPLYTRARAAAVHRTRGFAALCEGRLHPGQAELFGPLAEGTLDGCALGPSRTNSSIRGPAHDHPPQEPSTKRTTPPETSSSWARTITRRSIDRSWSATNTGSRRSSRPGE